MRKLNLLLLVLLCSIPALFANTGTPKGKKKNVAADTCQMAVKGKLLFEDNFKTPTEYTKEFQTVKEGWNVKAGHAIWKQTCEGVQSIWEKGHMPVLVYSGTFNDVIIEVDFRFQMEEGKWGGMRVSPTNPTLNPRAYAVSVWASSTNKGRPYGMVLEHDEWKPGVITTVDTMPTQLESGKWYTLRLEVVGSYALATCNGITVFGTHEKFGITPKTQISLGVGTCPHELKNFRVYEALPNPAWSKPKRKPNVPAVAGTN